MKIKKLQWSEPQKPDNDHYFYDHVKAEIKGVGWIYIDWKSWKKHPCFSIEFPWDAPFTSYNSLDSAKSAAQRCLEEYVRLFLEDEDNG